MAAEKCPVLKCAAVKDSKNCAELNVETSQTITNYNVAACTDKEKNICQYNPATLSKKENIVCTAPSKTNLIDKKPCAADAECASSKCTNNACVGLIKGVACTFDGQCAIGLHCHTETHTCEELKAAGSPCATDYECAYGHVCNNNVCFAMYTEDDGKVVSNEMACKSGFSTSVADKKTCVSTSLKTENKCETDAANGCIYSVTGAGEAVKEITSACLCNLAVEDKKFCASGSDSAEKKKVMEALKNIKNVHTYERTIVDTKTSVAANPVFTKVDPCVIKVFYPDYTPDPVPEASSFLQFSIIALVGLLFF